MQMGARWRVGETPHRGVPPTLHHCVAELEKQFPDADSWTLTWLEGRPVLALDAVAIVHVSATGIITTRIQQDSPVNGSATPFATPGEFSQNNSPDDEDDDDWLAN